MLEIAALARAFGVRVVPHNAYFGPGFLASLHVNAVLPEALFQEYCVADTPINTSLTRERLPLDRFPIPAYERIDGRRYFIGSVQFSSGCPYRCEFCDIPSLYGRVPRLKTPEQIVAELDAMRLSAATSMGAAP